MLCVGSSLVVHPVAGLPGLTLACGGRLAIVTKSATPYDGDAVLKLDGEVDEELGALVAALADDGASRADASPVAPDAVVFDNDGLLLDTESVWTRAERDLFERRGLDFTACRTSASWSAPRPRSPAGSSSGGSASRVAPRELIEELNELVVAELEHGVEAMVGRARAAARAEASGGRRSASSPTRRSSSCGARSRSSASTTASTSSLSAHEVAAPKPAPGSLPGGLPAARGRGRARGGRARGLARPGWRPPAPRA